MEYITVFSGVAINKKQIILGLVFSIVIFYILTLEEQRFAILLLIMIPMLLFNLFVGKTCYFEDKDNVYRFIKALPISKNNVVRSKFESVVTVIFSFFLIYILNAILIISGGNYYELDLQIIIFVSSRLIIYFSIFLFIFFKTNRNKRDSPTDCPSRLLFRHYMPDNLFINSVIRV